MDTPTFYDAMADAFSTLARHFQTRAREHSTRVETSSLIRAEHAAYNEAAAAVANLTSQGTPFADALRSVGAPLAMNMDQLASCSRRAVQLAIAADRQRRNLSILRLAHSGMKPPEIASKFRLHPKTVERIVRESKA